MILGFATIAVVLAVMMLVMLLLIWEGIQDERLDDPQFLWDSARKLYVFIMMEVARRAGEGDYDFRGNLFGDAAEPIQWKSG